MKTFGIVVLVLLSACLFLGGGSHLALEYFGVDWRELKALFRDDLTEFDEAHRQIKANPFVVDSIVKSLNEKGIPAQRIVPDEKETVIDSVESSDTQEINEDYGEW